MKHFHDAHNNRAGARFISRLFVSKKLSARAPSRPMAVTNMWHEVSVVTAEDAGARTIRVRQGEGAAGGFGA